MFSHFHEIQLFSTNEKFKETCSFYLDLDFKIIEESDKRAVFHYFSPIGMELSIVKKSEFEPIRFVIRTLEAKDGIVDPNGNIIEFVVGSAYEVGPVLVKEPNLIEKESIAMPEIKSKKRFGILTSGGDSCGMNAAVRALTRVSLQRDCLPFAIYEGYQGLVDGGDKIKQLNWDDVRGFLAPGGTKIGTARCKAFRERSGRLEACYNLIKNGIDALVVIGGDGSLTGADLFRQEWTGLVDELIALNRIAKEEAEHLRSDLAIVGLVGSIDNDMSSTDITIGAVTSLHRICESVDCLVSTAQSHQRAFVVVYDILITGSNGLALMAAIAVGADCVFLPERPPPLNQQKYGTDWAEEMCDIIKTNRSRGNRKSLVIVSEGAIDSDLKPITSDMVKKALENKLNLDTRVTTLGHVQRGGSSCAFDRYLATVQGVEAVESVLRSNPSTPAPMIGIQNNKIFSIPLMEAVELTKEVSRAIAKKDFKHAMELRDPDFNSSYKAFIESSLRTCLESSEQKKLRIGILHVGAPAGGMNAATRVIARLCHSRGYTPLAILNGFSGLVMNEIRELKWEDVRGWQTQGGTNLGTNRDHPSIIPGVTSFDKPVGVGNFVDTGSIAYHLQKHSIDSLIFIGGFEAFTSLIALSEARKLYPALRIPLIQIPATISNNVPATDYSIGSDTALNVIVNACDSIKLSANASRQRVFVVEVHGGNCGYLSTLSGLTVGAVSAYIPEENLTLATLSDDVRYLIKRYKDEQADGYHNEGRVILRSENCIPSVYSTKFISEMLRAEGKGFFDSREAILGHLQQGDVPSPLDRIRATKMAVKAIDFIQEITQNCNESGKCYENYTADDSNAVVIGIQGAELVATPVVVAKKLANMAKRTTVCEWWVPLRKLIKILGKRENSSL